MIKIMSRPRPDTEIEDLAQPANGRSRQSWASTLLATQRAGARGRSAAAVRVAAAIVFIVFGIGKFVNHSIELASFREYGVPDPDAFVYMIGALEIVGGALLLVGLLARPAALALAGDMIGAIVVSGLGHGETISLTLAPVLFVAMCFLIWAGAGGAAVDTLVLARLDARRVE